MTMSRIDAHVHVFAKESAEFPREVNEALPAEREETAEDLLEEMEASGIEKACLVQIGGTALEHHAYLEHCLNTYPDRFRGIGVVPDFQNPCDHMDRLADSGGVVGFRLFDVGGPTDPLGDMDCRKFETFPVWEHAAKKGYTIWLYPKASEAHCVPFLVDAFPEIQVVFNHMLFCPGEGAFTKDEKGRPRIDTPIPPLTRYNTLGLYQYENVCVKLSGQYAFSQEAYPYLDLKGWHKNLITTFGADRCIWATDFPWIRKEPGYAALSKVLDGLLPDLSDEDRAKVMGDTADRRLFS
jgi:L-fuconolactonase